MVTWHVLLVPLYSLKVEGTFSSFEVFISDARLKELMKVHHYNYYKCADGWACKRTDPTIQSMTTVLRELFIFCTGVAFHSSSSTITEECYKVY